ncbi:MAG: hypothetical protein A2046_04875 [Bacteroidetes bacterium GWA2_30_7]|nr:MAG: hypothetical protein A2046_04875 [Bacteroidetes bacterium GWA2_30_7]
MNNIKDKIIISTQPEENFTEFAKPLEVLGAKVINLPMISVKESVISEQESVVLKNIQTVDWLIFTSKNGIIYFFKKLETLTGNINISKNINIAVIGQKTGKELEKYGKVADYISKSNLAETFATELKNNVITKNSKILLLLGNLAGNTIENKLEGFANITRINCYETYKPDYIDKHYLEIINNAQYDIIIFTSSSGFHNFVEVFNSKENLKKLKIGSIGKSTTKAIEEYGVKPLFTAQQSNTEGLISEILKYYSN